MDDKKRFQSFAWALVAGVAAMLVGLIFWQVRRDAAQAADRTLSTLGLTQQLVESQENRNLSTRGELIAGNQAVVSYMTQALGSALPGDSVDSSSIVDLLEERRSQLGLDLAAVIDADGKLLAATETYVEGHDFARDPVFADARKAQATRTGLWAEGGRLLHLAILPLARHGSGDAYLLVGEMVGQEFVQTIASIGAADVAIVTRTPAGAAQMPVTTLDATDGTAVLEALRARSGDAGNRFGIELPDRHAESKSAPLFGNPDVRVLSLAKGLPASTIVANYLPTVLFAIVALLGLAMALGWYWRQIAAPLQGLERLMRRATETGDTHLHIAEQGAPAIVRVAAAFNRLMGKLHAPRR